MASHSDVVRIKADVRPAMVAIEHAKALAMVYHARFGEIPELPEELIEYHQEPTSTGTVVVMHPSNDLMDMILLMRQTVYGDA